MSVHWYKDEKVIYIASIMFVAEVKLDITVELVEENIREELTGEVADDDAAAFRLVEKTFAGWELFPVRAFAADGDIAHWFIKNYFMPKITQGVIEALLVVRVTADAVFAVGAFAVIKLFI